MMFIIKARMRINLSSFRLDNNLAQKAKPYLSVVCLRMIVQF